MSLKKRFLRQSWSTFPQNLCRSRSLIPAKSFFKSNLRKLVCQLCSIMLKYVTDLHHIKIKNLDQKFCAIWRICKIAISCKFFTEILSNIAKFHLNLRFFCVKSGIEAPVLDIFLLMLSCWFEFQFDQENIDKLVPIYLEFLKISIPVFY